MYYHGTGSENAGRAYTEAPMQHVQRNALRKKCMKSTFTLLEIRTSKYLLLFLLYLSICLLYTFFTITRFFLSFSFSLYLFHFLSISLPAEIPYARSFEVQHFLRILPESSHLVYRVSFLPSSIPYGKCILIPKCISMHRVLL